MRRLKNSAVPDLAMVPRCEIASSRLMPMPLSRTVSVPASGSASIQMASSPVLAQQGRIRQRQEAQLVVGVRGVGNQLPKEDLPVAVQGMDHQMQQFADFGLEAQGFALARHVITRRFGPCADQTAVWGRSLGFQASPRSQHACAAAPTQSSKSSQSSRNTSIRELPRLTG